MLFKKIILLFAIVYAAATLFFNLPRNYLKISNSKAEAYFQFFLFQRWNFFAPPPNYNERLYYTFKSRTDTALVVYEVFEPLYKQKSQKAPFNSREDLLDYLLSNSLNGMAEEINEAKEYKRYLIATKQNIQDVDLLELVVNDIQASDNFLTLFNYGKIIAESRIKGRIMDSVKITTSRIFIPRFTDRFKTDSVRREEIFFQSKFININ